MKHVQDKILKTQHSWPESTHNCGANFIDHLKVSNQYLLLTLIAMLCRRNQLSSQLLLSFYWMVPSFIGHYMLFCSCILWYLSARENRYNFVHFYQKICLSLLGRQPLSFNCRCSNRIISMFYSTQRRWNAVFRLRNMYAYQIQKHVTQKWSRSRSILCHMFLIFNFDISIVSISLDI